METSFGTWLKGQREALGLTQQELAEQVPCSVEAIRKLESGTRKPSKQIAERLAACLRVPADEREAFVLFARAHGVAPASPASSAAAGGPASSAEGSPSVAPWRSFRSHLTNLPNPLTSLVGRDAQVQAVCEHFLERQARLVTLTGPPGIGKTRLAMEVAARMLEQFADGVYFVELAPLRDEGLVVPTIARTLGVQERAHQAISSVLEQHLADKRIFLVLDNFEQVVAAAPIIAGLLEKSAWLRVLCTSREPLRVRGERRFPVPGLPAPDAERRPVASLRELAAYPAVALFLDRAQSANPDIELGLPAVRAAAEIGSRLEGIPLALELVAAHSGRFWAEDLLGRLARGAGVLELETDRADGADIYRDLPERHWTLGHAISWSYDLLSEEERVLFRHMGVFAGSCTPEAVADVCEPADALQDERRKTKDEGGDAPSLSLGSEQAVRRAVRALADKSLLYIMRNSEIGMRNSIGRPTTDDSSQAHRPATENASSEASGTTHYALRVTHYEDAVSERYGMLEVIREYARQRMVLAGELEATCERHLRYYVGLAEEAEGRMVGPQEKSWLARLEEEHDNFRAALGWALEPGRGEGEEEHGGISTQVEMALRIGGALWRFWRTHGHWTEGRRWLEMALERANALPGMDSKGVTSSDIAQDERLATVVTRALHGAGVLAINQGDFTSARAFHTVALAMRKQGGDTLGVSSSLEGLGNVAWGEGDYEAALAYLAESLALRRELGSKPGMAWVLNRMGIVTQDGGDYDRARSLFEEALALWREVGYQSGIAFALCHLGQTLERQGDYDRAQMLFEECLPLFRALEYKFGIAETLQGLGKVAHDRHDYAGARAFTEDGLTLFRELHDQANVAGCLERLAGAAVEIGQARQAVRLLGEAARLREVTGAPVPLADRPFVEHYRSLTEDLLGATAFEIEWGQAAVPEPWTRPYL
jgi:predicted ATPase/transcriptional regulator with XRE-family HTH domain